MFGLFNHKKSAPNTRFTVEKSVKFVQDASGQSAVSLEKVKQTGGVDLHKRTVAIGISLQKRNMAGIRAQVVVLLDHSVSMYADYISNKVQDLTERFLAFGLQVDVDGEIPVIPFDFTVKPAVNVNLNNFSGVVQRDIFRQNSMGSTNLAAGLESVREMAKLTDAPIFLAVVTDGEPDDKAAAKKVVCDLSRYPVFVKFLSVKKVTFLEQLDNLSNSERLLDNVNTKEYTDLSNVSDKQFADDMTDEWDSWVALAHTAGILTD